MAPKYEIQRSILQATSTDFSAAARNWDLANSHLGGAKLFDDDLGIIGRMANIVSSYNQAVDTTWQKLNAGAKALRDGGAALDKVGVYYEQAEKRASGNFRP